MRTKGQEIAEDIFEPGSTPHTELANKIDAAIALAVVDALQQVDENAFDIAVENTHDNYRIVPLKAFLQAYLAALTQKAGNGV